MTERTARHDGLMRPTSEQKRSPRRPRRRGCCHSRAMVGPCAALLHMIKIYLDQIEKNETSGNNKLRVVQQGVLCGEGREAGHAAVCVCESVCLRAGNFEAAIDGPLSRVEHSHTHTHERAHIHMAYVVHVRLLDASTSSFAL